MSCAQAAVREPAADPVLTLRARPRRIALVGNRQRRQERPVRPADRALRHRLELSRHDGGRHHAGAPWSAPKSATSSTRRASTRSRERSARTNWSRGASWQTATPNVVVQVADARNLRRALMLTSQLAGIRPADGARAEHDRRSPGARHRHRRRGAVGAPGHPGRSRRWPPRGAASPSCATRSARAAVPAFDARPTAATTRASAHDLAVRFRRYRRAIRRAHPGASRAARPRAAHRSADSRARALRHVPRRRRLRRPDAGGAHRGRPVRAVHQPGRHRAGEPGRAVGARARLPRRRVRPHHDGADLRHRHRPAGRRHVLPRVRVPRGFAATSRGWRSSATASSAPWD